MFVNLTQTNNSSSFVSILNATSESDDVTVGGLAYFLKHVRIYLPSALLSGIGCITGSTGINLTQWCIKILIIFKKLNKIT